MFVLAMSPCSSPTVPRPLSSCSPSPDPPSNPRVGGATPISQRGNRLKVEGSALAQGHRARWWWSWDLSPEICVQLTMSPKDKLEDKIPAPHPASSTCWDQAAPEVCLLLNCDNERGPHVPWSGGHLKVRAASEVAEHWVCLGPRGFPRRGPFSDETRRVPSTPRCRSAQPRCHSPLCNAPVYRETC